MRFPNPPPDSRELTRRTRMYRLVTEGAGFHIQEVRVEWIYRFKAPDGKMICEIEGPTPESDGVTADLFAAGMAHIVRSSLQLIAKSGATQAGMRHVKEILNEGVKKRPSIIQFME